MKLEARNAVTNVDKRGTRIHFDHARTFLHGFQNEYAGPFGHRLILAGDKIIIGTISVLVFIESLGTSSKHLFDVLRDRLALFPHSLDRFSKADRVPRLENAYLPSESPFQGV